MKYFIKILLLSASTLYFNLANGQMKQMYIDGKDTLFIQDPVTHTGKIRYTYLDTVPNYAGDARLVILSQLGRPIESLPKTNVIFLVKSDGSLGKITVNSSASADVKNKIIEIMRAMPKWSPGYVGGKTVDAFHTLKIK